MKKFLITRVVEATTLEIAVKKKGETVRVEEIEDKEVEQKQENKEGLGFHGTK